MEQLVRKFEELKAMLQSASDIAEPFEYFMTNFGENLSFMKSSKVVKKPALLELMQVIGKKQFQHTLSGQSCMFQQSPLVPRLVHGVCEVPRKVVVLFYAEELGQGMISMVDYADPRRVNYYRFTTITSSNGNLSLVQGDPSLVH